jgi:outer membrane protein OmpA-like peptidoglycan-associated protein
LLTPTKQDGSFVAAPQPIYGAVKPGDDLIPDFYKKMGWSALVGKPFDKIKVRRIKNEKKWLLGQEETDTDEPVIEKTENDEDVIINFGYWPKNAEETNSAKVAMEKERNIFTQSLSEALYHAWNAKKAKNVLILYNTKYISQAEVAALGTAFVTGAPIGPKSEAASNPVAGMAGGSGFGTAKSYVYKEPIFWVIAFNKYDAEPLYLPPPKEENITPAATLPPQTPPVVEKAAPAPEVKVIEPEKPKIEMAKLPRLYFDTDESVIKNTLRESNITGQLENVQVITDWFVKFVKDNPDSKTKILLLGSADERHTKEHNLILGFSRATNSGEEIKARAEIAGVSSQIIKDRLIPVSVGEDHPISNLLEKNRSVTVLIAEDLSDL